MVQTQPPAVAGAAVAGAAAAGTAAAVAGSSAAEAKPADQKSPATETQAEKAAPATAQASPPQPEADSPVPLPVPAPEKSAAANVAPPPKDSTPSPTDAAKPAPSGQDTAAKDAAAKDSFAAVSKPAQPAPQATAVPVAAAQPAAPPAAATAATVPEAPATAAPTVAAAPQTPPPPVAARAANQQRNAALTRSAEQNADTPTTATANSAGQPQRPQNRLGLAGPLAWPTAFEDSIGFTLWPGEYGERLRGHGIGDVMSVAMVSSRDLINRVRGSLAMRSESKDDANAGVVCNIDPATEQWPASQIEQSLQLNDKQRDALKQLKTAFSEAAANIKSSCRDEASIAPIERLRAMQGTLWAVHDALQGLRGPLAKFYDSLTDEQRQKFAAPASAQADPRSMRPAQIAQLCGAPPATGRQARAAEEQLNLDKTQRASLEAFQKKAGEMGQFLMASCLKPVASTPVERIDAAADRLTAVIFAASSVSLALNDFYNQLNEQQKSKFNAALR
ncbi:Spy/CpxP family protein refolding chaperone [Rhodoplanes sp. Z2-YC6860]|uniref:Spy/CpxP family protein refolding chaperone n=1 Tax=Rhodoplanes sp. Z2-YC6860 TaxID=674703 RepID=UPI0012EDA20F|nr:Spy/CpxP family protein refolding chaperone [Rhodoplanes sp. Z2-YC6860]